MRPEEHDMVARLLHLLVGHALLLAPELRRELIHQQALKLAAEALGPKRKDKVHRAAQNLAAAAISLLDALELSGGEAGHA